MGERLALDLAMANQFHADEIQARQPTGGSRPLREHEAVSLLLKALGVFSQRAKVITMNIKVQGRPAALTIIPEASYALDRAGKTTLRKEKENEHEAPHF